MYYIKNVVVLVVGVVEELFGYEDLFGKLLNFGDGVYVVVGVFGM